MRRWTLGPALLLAATACGSTPELSAEAGRVLGPDTAAVTRAATARDVTATEAALRRLRADVAHELAVGHVTAARAGRILAAAARVETDLAVTRAPAARVRSSPAAKAPVGPSPTRRPATRGDGEKKRSEHGGGEGGD